MGRRIIEDIVVRKKKAIPFKTEIFAVDGKKQETQMAVCSPCKHFWSKRGFWFIVFGGAIALLFFVVLLNKTSSSLVKVTPKEKVAQVDSVFQAGRGEKNNGLSFEILQMEYEQNGTTTASGSKKMESRASGKVVIYNAYNSKTQLLVKGTRLESPKGKIFRTDKQVTVPGAPGSVEVTVYADAPGEEYNVGLADFTLPGFKGSLRYQKFYGRSKTEIKGGVKGVAPVFTKEDLAKTNGELKEKISLYLKNNVGGNLPEGFLLYDKAMVFGFTEGKNNPKAGEPAGKNKEASYTLKGSVVGFLIKQTDLSDELVKKYVGDEFVSKVRLENIKDLEFVLLSNNKENKKISFSVKGNARFVWNIDPALLTADLIKAENGDYSAVISNHSYELTGAEIIFSPSWWTMIPSNPSRVKVEEVLK